MVEANVYGYETTQTDADVYGYGQASNDACNQYGYGEDNQGHHGADPAARDRHRPRRRGSVTKYSLEAQKQVKDSLHEDLSSTLQTWSEGLEAEEPTREAPGRTASEKKRWHFARKK